MFDFIQQASGTLGNSTAASELAHKEKARILVISDSHGNTDVVRAILQRFGMASDAVCFCGDGSRDILSVLAGSLSDADFAKCLPPVAALVQGNGDESSYSIRVANGSQTFSIPHSKLLVAAGKIIFLTHGHLYDVYYGSNELYHAAKREKASLALFGHTHIPYAKEEDGILLLNPGSCARPRRGSPNSFAVVTINPHGIDYQFFSVTEAMQFEAYRPPHEEISLLWI